MTLVLTVENRRLVLGLPMSAPETTALAHIGDLNNPHQTTLELARVAGDTFAGDVDMGGNQLANLPAPASGTDAANKDYVDAQVGTDWVEDKFTPTAGQISFTLSQAPLQADSLELAVNGIEYERTVDFSVSGVTLTWNDPFVLKTTDKLIVQYK